MLIGGDEHEMAAFTPDQERAAASGSTWKPPAAGRALPGAARVEDGHKDSTGRPSPSMLAWHGADNEPVRFTEHPAPPPAARRQALARRCHLLSRLQPGEGPARARAPCRPAGASPSLGRGSTLGSPAPMLASAPGPRGTRPGGLTARSDCGGWLSPGSRPHRISPSAFHRRDEETQAEVGTQREE